MHTKTKGRSDWFSQLLAKSRTGGTLTPPVDLGHVLNFADFTFTDSEVMTHWREQRPVLYSARAVNLNGSTAYVDYKRDHRRGCNGRKTCA